MSETFPPPQKFFWHPLFFQNLATVALCIIGAKMGLEFTIPPGYTSLLWPPAGIALGMMLVYGRRLWPGIFIGGFLVNGYFSGLLNAIDIAQVFEKIASVTLITSGYTIQTLAGHALIQRYVGVPLHLERKRQIFLLLAVLPFVVCTISAVIAQATLYGFGVTPFEDLDRGWVAWWIGDSFGMMLFTPLIALPFQNQNGPVFWKGNAIRPLPLLSAVIALMPLGLTVYIWTVASDRTYEQAFGEFQTIAHDNENALTYRIDSYAHALLGGMAFLQHAPDMSRTQWNDYMSVLSLEESYPGVNGFGVIVPVPASKSDSFTQRMRQEGLPDFKIHPQTFSPVHYVIKYIYPEKANQEAIGLDIGFEEYRREAAELSRDSGHPAITKKISLVQDAAKSPGFLLLYPVYQRGAPLITVSDRRAAFLGWIYAPFIAENFLKNLNTNLNDFFSIRIYDGGEEKPENLIYSSSTGEQRIPVYTVQKKLHVMQQDWLVIWDSTIAFEQQEQNEQPFFILVLGVFLSGVCILFLVMFSLRQSTLEQMTQERANVIPLVVFMISLCGTVYLFKIAQDRETGYVQDLVKRDTNRIVSLVSTDTNEIINATTRLGERWTIANRTDARIWESDTQNYIHDFPSLLEIAWVDPEKNIQLISRRKGFRADLQIKDIVHSAESARLFKTIHRTSRPMMTDPIDHVGGHLVVVAYFPIMAFGKPDGYIMAVASIPSFMDNVIEKEGFRDYFINLQYKNQSVYTYGISNRHDNGKGMTTPFSILGKDFVFTFFPHTDYVNRTSGFLPHIILMIGLIVSVLMSTTTRAILVARVRAARLRTAMVMAEAANTAKGTFLSNISHEIRTPLNGVLSTAELLEKTHLDPKQRRYVDIIQSAGELLLNLLNDVLDLSKIEMLKFELHNAPFELRRAIMFSIDLFMMSAKSKSIDLAVEISPDLPEYVIGDSQRFSQILTNLVGNAIKYTEKGSVHVLAIPETVNGAPFMKVSVHDTGMGIPKESLPSLFTRFMQAHRHKRISGTGLGLAIAKSLIELMGGTIGVESIEGVGSTFWFRVPVLETVPPPQVNTVDHDQSAPLSLPSHSLKILFVEDTEVNREIICDMFDHIGYTVDTAENGQEAVDKVNQNTYDIIFMDCNMPVMDGYEATRQIRKSHGPDLPIIAISAHAFTHDIQLCFDAGMNDYVTKPVRLEKLVEALKKWGGYTESPSESKGPDLISTPPPLNDGHAERIDPSILDSLTGHAPERKVKLAGMTLRNARDLHQEIHTYFAKNDRIEMARQAHALKSVAAQVGGNALASACLAVEKLKEISETATRIDSLIAALDTEFDYFCTYLEGCLTSGQNQVP